MVRSLFGLFRRNSSPKKTPLLVLTRSYESALEVAEYIDREGCVPRFLPINELPRAGEIDPLPAGVLILRELESEEKVKACAYLREHERYRAIPIAAIMTLTEGALDLPADVVMRPPASLRTAIHEIKRTVESGRVTVQ